MYIPEHFAIERTEAMHAIIQAHPLGILVTTSNHSLDANHIPFELTPDRRALTAHVARANPVWKLCTGGMDVLVIFRGAESYISPNWYPSKHLFHRQVPTWNYQVVHVRGRMQVQDDERFVRGVVARLTRTHEAGEPRPWKMGDSAPEFIDSMLQAIVGIEIAITAMEGKAKLSQNKEVADRIRAAEMLESKGEGALAHAMRSAQ